MNPTNQYGVCYANRQWLYKGVVSLLLEIERPTLDIGNYHERHYTDLIEDYFHAFLLSIFSDGNILFQQDNVIPIRARMT